jgi:hypothetical protein
MRKATQTMRYENKRTYKCILSIEVEKKKNVPSIRDDRTRGKRMNAYMYETMHHTMLLTYRQRSEVNKFALHLIMII